MQRRSVVGVLVGVHLVGEVVGRVSETAGSRLQLRLASEGPVERNCDQPLVVVD